MSGDAQKLKQKIYDLEFEVKSIITRSAYDHVELVKERDEIKRRLSALENSVFGPQRPPPEDIGRDTSHLSSFLDGTEGGSRSRKGSRTRRRKKRNY
jgi:hypothetical protein